MRGGRQTENWNRGGGEGGSKKKNYSEKVSSVLDTSAVTGRKSEPRGQDGKKIDIVEGISEKVHFPR